ncbi:hypothetical protein ABTZ46_17100 [Nocardioides sp. NPDC126508]
MTSPAAKPFFEPAKQATADSAYIVEPAAHGFDFNLDIVNAKWWSWSSQ